ncbi:MAG: NADH-quinone oxidoreductase subunit B [Dehalococcoidia bacterium]|nr:NADH-quinone oxidoreductase subunit B [Dehalococcoidia bacterium]
MEVAPSNHLRTFELEREEGAIIESLRALSRERLPDPNAWLDGELKRNVLTTTLDAALNWARAASLWPNICFTACCTFEVIATSSSRFDIARFGMEVLRASPRQADLMITAGTLTWKMAPQIRRLYDQMAEPKWVIGMGACGITGGIFRGSYSVVPGYNHIIPVDVYLPGCPPRPESLLNAVEMLRKKIKRSSARASR